MFALNCTLSSPTTCNWTFKLAALYNFAPGCIVTHACCINTCCMNLNFPCPISLLPVFLYLNHSKSASEFCSVIPTLFLSSLAVDSFVWLIVYILSFFFSGFVSLSDLAWLITLFTTLLKSKW